MGLRAILSKKARRGIKHDLKVKEKHNIEVRDSLAMERTKLANERTFLAYLRTAMALVLAGLTFIKIFDDPFYIGVGLTALPIGVGVAYFGYYRFNKKKREVSRHVHEYVPTSPVHAEVAAQEKEEETKKQ